MSRLIILGSTECLGRHVLRQALATGHEVAAPLATVGSMIPRRPLLLRIKRACATTTATLGPMLICVLMWAGHAYGLDPDKRITQYIHTSWRTQDGSLPAGMFSITQTADGFLWLVSLPGDVYRFDGVRFVRWPVPPGPSGRIFADSAGGLWVTARELVHLKKGVVASQFELAGTHGFQSISEGPEGTVWVGLRGQDAPLCNASDHGVKCIGEHDGLPLSAINAVLPDGSGGLWLGGPTALVHWNRGGVSETYPVKAPITSLARTPDGTLWVGLSEEGPGLGLQGLRDGVLKTFVTPHLDGSTLSVTSLMVDRDGNLWAGTDAGGVVRVHGDSVERYRQTDGLSGDSVWALFEDREGIVWAGTTSGIDSFRDPRVVTFSAVQGLGKDLAAGILAGRDGTLWVGNNGSLDRIRNGTVTSIGRSSGLPGNQVAAMLEDRAGNIWVGVDDRLYLFKDGRFRRLPEPDQQPLGMVVGMAEDIDGDVWAACASRPRTLVRIRDFQVRDVFRAPQIPAGSHHLAPDPRGGIWIATSTGDVVLMRNGTVETTVRLGPRSSALNRHIVADADGSVLVSSETGLLGWRAGKVQRMTTKNGLPCDFVMAFVQDRQKHWWLYTRCGVVSFSDAELQKWWANPDAMIRNRVYDAFDGAQPNIGSFNAAASTSDGRVWFSSGVVVQMLDPSRISEPARPAAASIESVIVDREEFAAVGNLVVGPHPRELQIHYTSPTFSIPQKVTFRYKLDGYDDDWHEAGPRREAFYTELPPGTYAFRVVASNSDGVWNETAATLVVAVAPAFYQTTWFRAVGAALFLALLWAAYQFRMRKVRHAFELTLEGRVGERTRIARELHDTLLQSFHGLLLRFQTASYLLPDRPDEAKDKLDIAIEQAAKAITEGRNAVQGLRASTVERNDLAVAIRTLGDELAGDTSAQPPPTFHVAVEGHPRDLYPILRDDIYKIAAEALRNAFRHAQAGRVEVDIRYGDDQFRLRVRDDGKGIDSNLLANEGLEGHYGLRGMPERAALIGGKLAVWSELGAGTEVELRLPAGIVYAISGRRRWWSRPTGSRRRHEEETRHDRQQHAHTDSRSR
jgi:signal transduction histidine kinase/ligand-binding sensor domain-containing protein